MLFETMSFKDKKTLNSERSQIFYLPAQEIPTVLSSALFKKHVLYTGAAPSNPELLLIWKKNEEIERKPL